jgi:hypothetical protein
MIGILGSGFGIYGYLPASVAETDGKVALLSRYRETVENRPDIVHLIDRISWQPNKTTFLQAIDTLVVARRPMDQADDLQDILSKSTIQRLLLEKPLAPTPSQAIDLDRQLVLSKKIYRIGYTFRLTTWANTLKREILQNKAITGISIEWTFLAHHFAAKIDTWKRHDANGGGAVRFYGIHLIALLAELGYRDAGDVQTQQFSLGQTSAFRAVFTGPGLPDCRVCVDSRAVANRFCVKVHDKAATTDTTLIDLVDPFSELNPTSQTGTYDRRVTYLATLVRSLSEERKYHDWYEPALRLWQAVETNTD